MRFCARHWVSVFCVVHRRATPRTDKPTKIIVSALCLWWFRSCVLISAFFCIYLSLLLLFYFSLIVSLSFCSFGSRMNAFLGFNIPICCLYKKSVFFHFCMKFFFFCSLFIIFVNFSFVHRNKNPLFSPRVFSVWCDAAFVSTNILVVYMKHEYHCTHYLFLVVVSLLLLLLFVCRWRYCRSLLLLSLLMFLLTLLILNDSWMLLNLPENLRFQMSLKFFAVWTVFFVRSLISQFLFSAYGAAQIHHRSSSSFWCCTQIAFVLLSNGKSAKTTTIKQKEREKKTNLFKSSKNKFTAILFDEYKYNRKSQKKLQWKRFYSWFFHTEISCIFVCVNYNL